MQLDAYGETEIWGEIVINSSNMEKKVIYIEGTSETDNGSLRNAFSKLFEKELKGNMPQVIMGDGKEQTIDKFLTKPLTANEQRYLLIDSDQLLVDNKRQIIVRKIKERNVNKKVDKIDDKIFFMVQEAEAWLLSQPEILNKVGLKTKSIPKCPACEITKPSNVLEDVYRKSGKQYHKVIEFVKVFTLLDTHQLKKDFVEFDSLIKTLT